MVDSLEFLEDPINLAKEEVHELSLECYQRKTLLSQRVVRRRRSILMFEAEESSSSQVKSSQVVTVLRYDMI